MVSYVGIRTNAECVVRRVERRGDVTIRTRDMSLLADSDGLLYTIRFDWGTDGDTEGRRLLALAILSDHTGDDALVDRLHQEFNTRVVARLPIATWELTGEAVERVVRELRGG